jgi:hypothetical protein
MPLSIKNPDVDHLVERLVILRRTTKTEVVRQALLHELERLESAQSLVERGVTFVRALRAQASPKEELPADKAFIDELYRHP